MKMTDFEVEISDSDSKMRDFDLKTAFVAYITDLQNRITSALEAFDGAARFEEDVWHRAEGGGGKTRIIRQGRIFEKGGVNTSVVQGKLPIEMQKQFKTPHEQFFACGISLVLHPHNPHLPTTHANFRYFELTDTEGVKQDAWVGGGIDLTPYYLSENDMRHFHQTLKNACDSVRKGLHADYKKQCDAYFYIPHRQEMRGVGGIFFDYLRENAPLSKTELLALTWANGDAFLEAYLPILEKNQGKTFSNQEKEWQEIRRGRYAEFNLVYDRGTLFGLKTGGRIESILMSLPTTARWEYNYVPPPDSPEAQMSRWYQPQEWLLN